MNPNPLIKLYEIFVPTIFPDTEKSIKTRHHRVWDAKVRSISGGITICPVTKGQWVHERKVFEERIIPVRVACTEEQIEEIISFSLKHYRQIAIMFFVLSDKVEIRYNEKA